MIAGWLHKIWLQTKALFKRRQLERDLEDELAFHLAMREKQNREAGAASEEARHAARRQFGNLGGVRERSREVWTFHSLEDLWQDLLFGARMLRKNPGFTLVAVLTLALGIGANTAIFSVVNAILLRPLPYPDSDRLVYASLRTVSKDFARGGYGMADFLAASEQQHSFSHLAAIITAGGNFSLMGGASPESIHGLAVTSQFFDVLGCMPFLGRTFLPEEGKVGAPRTVVISHEFWRRYFHSDPQAVGRTIVLNDSPLIVIGVMPADFHLGADDVEVWPNFQLQPATSRPPYFFLPIGRLKSGVTLEQAQADLSTIAKQVERQFPNSPYDTAVLHPLKSLLVGDTRLPLLALLGAVGLVLLIATVNVANLQMARAVSRRREMAIRGAIGAGRGRLLRQLLTESVLLSAFGGALGLGLAAWGLRFILSLDPERLPRAREVSLDSRVLAFTALIALLSGILFGLAPGARVFRSKASDALKEGGRGFSEHAGRMGFRSALVIVEFSLTLVLLIGAGLLLRSFSRLTATSPGFSPGHILTAHISLPRARYSKESQISLFHDQLLERLSNLPGVQNAAVSMSLPPDKLQIRNPFHLFGEPLSSSAPLHLAEEMTISPGYFQTLGIPLLKGRFFDDADRNRKDQILIVNRAMAEQFFPGRNPVGQRIQTGDPNPDSPWETIVGVVGDVKYQDLEEKPYPTLYVPYFESGWTTWSASMYLIVRSPASSHRLAPEIRETVWSLDRDLPVTEVKTMDELLSTSVGQSRFRAILLGSFAALALLLAAIGVYGVVAYSVGQRTQELGVRLALGAQPGDMLRPVLGQGLRLVLVGSVFGVAGALLVTRFIASLLFGVEATDPGTFILSAALLILVVLAACYIPARRATRVDPMVALRYE